MTIDEMKKLTLQEIQDMYCQYLKKQNLSQNTIKTSCTDAFYLYRKDKTIDFWELLKSPDFEDLAYKHLYLALSKHSHGDIESNIKGYMWHIRKFRKFIYSYLDSVNTTGESDKDTEIPKPCAKQVEKYLKLWDTLENYSLQECALNKLFFQLAPSNTNISDILLKSSVLNDFYSTNIFNIFHVAKHILSLNIDDRLKAGDETLVEDMKNVIINNKKIRLYSFSTKYCSHHNPEAFPIYDSFVDKVLRYFRDKDGFSKFKNEDLKNYKTFKSILKDFQIFYDLQKYSFKEVDRFLWQFGKEYFPKKFK